MTVLSLPSSGSVPNKSRNRARSFSRVFGLRVNDYMFGFADPSNRLFQVTEPRMDEIVYAAAKEQGII